MNLIFLDFQKAFDIVSHQRLLLKLKAYGITGQALFGNFIRRLFGKRKRKLEIKKASIMPRTDAEQWNIIEKGSLTYKCC